MYKLLAVRDSALNAFGRPFVAPATGAAVRSFNDEVNNPQSDLFKHPDDYELYELGEFDDSDGTFHLLPQPKSILRGKDVKNPADTKKLSAIK
jgi:hypothetical protein